MSSNIDVRNNSISWAHGLHTSVRIISFENEKKFLKPRITAFRAIANTSRIRKNFLLSETQLAS